MSTQALAQFGVYGRAGHQELAVLALANQYRIELCDLYHEQHRATLDLREKQFPGLFAAMVRRETIGAKIFAVEREIKAHHSEVRDRNVVPFELAERLRDLRIERALATAEAARLKAEWVTMLREAKKNLGDADVRKNTKTLAARKALYAKIRWPDRLIEYGLLYIEFDLKRRQLREKYQSLGLHYAIRGEIDAASKPKLTKDGPGMRYIYHRQPEPRPWEKLTQQFGSGGLAVGDALAGTPQFSLMPIYSNHPAGGDETVYLVRHQIGTRSHPQMIEYRTKLHRPLPNDAMIQRWTLLVRPNGRRECVPIISGVDFSKPTGSGTFAYDLSWTALRHGVRVCRFWGEHVNETLVLPQWLVDRRMAVKEAQQLADNESNDMLEQRGIARSKRAGPRTLFGTAALAEFCGARPEDTAARNVLDLLRRDLDRAARIADRARRCIESIYETVARRVCSLHSEIVPDKIMLTRIKRYDTRDLLCSDVLPERSREILFAVAPGKLRALLDGYGLASVEVPPPSPVVARETDLFTTYVDSLGRKTGRKPNARCRRSQHAIQVDSPQSVAATP